VPSVIQVLLIPMSVEAPKWLASNGNIYDARNALAALRGTGADIEDEVREITSASVNAIQHSDDPEALESRPFASASSAANLITGRTDSENGPPPPPKNFTFKELFSTRALKRPLLAAFGLQVAQQFSGINAAVYYSSMIQKKVRFFIVLCELICCLATIFSQSYDPDTAIKLTLLISVVNLVATIVSSMFIDKLGRRTLLMAAETGMGFSAFVVVIAVRTQASPEVVVAALMLFVGSFGIGLGSIPW
jgi:SP family facilitated glucose transporter-like MFS transporter 1/SP family facilitated glucose transporter-like MFS transporter 3